MKVLIVSTSDIDGGAARAAYRLHQSLLMENINSHMLVMKKNSDDFTVTGPVSKIEKAINMLKPTLDSIPVNFYKDKTPTLFSVSWLFSKKVIDKINALKPDVVHLHWINGGMIRIEDLPKIKAPLIWSLHDNWAFTGGCHIKWECEKYKNSCGSCPRLTSNKEHDLSRKIWERKQKTFKKLPNMTIVGLSNWLNECSKSSSLLRKNSHVNLPNPIDTTVFKNFDKNKARELWGLPTNINLVLFGANSATSDINKGFKELCSALQKIKNKNIELVVFGSSEPQIPQNFGFKTRYLGRLHDDVSLVTLYSAVDVMLVPSRQEAFGQTASEAMACGTPVVAFGHTGLLDIIDHKKNGYLAEPLDTNDLASGVEWVLDHEKYDDLCFNARNKIIREFDSRIVAAKYISLYKVKINAITDAS